MSSVTNTTSPKLSALLRCILLRVLRILLYYPVIQQALVIWRVQNYVCCDYIGRVEQLFEVWSVAIFVESSPIERQIIPGVSQITHHHFDNFIVDVDVGLSRVVNTGNDCSCEVLTVIVRNVIDGLCFLNRIS